MTIAIIGAGTMGAGIGEVAALAGHHVIIVDQVEAARDRGRTNIAKNLARLVARGKIDEASCAAALANIRWTGDLTDIGDAALVIEAIIERLDAKQTLLAALEAVVSTTCTIATNTSSLSVEAMVAALHRPERFIGLHFFNPVPVMKLVEVIRTSRTAPEVADTATDLMRAWGKTPVAVKDVPGFIVNRVARPFYAEGFAALGEGIDASAIDALLTGAGGFRMGPLALADLIGHDVNYAVAAGVFDGYEGKTRFRLQGAQRALVEAGTFGRKTGSGVYDYAAEPAEPHWIEAPPSPDNIRVSKDVGDLAPLVERLVSSGIATELGDMLPQGTIQTGSTVIAACEGRVLSSREDCTVLLDTARDLASATVLGLTAIDEHAAAQAASLLAGAGIRAIALPDRAGLIVLRTLAQLANSAADAVRDEVATAADIDAAMRLGANHPEGPLTWADRFGRGRVATILDQIACADEDDLYRASPWLNAANTHRSEAS
jgi:3-hydroxybutyryl-CoA dehydrogenase